MPRNRATTRTVEVFNWRLLSNLKRCNSLSALSKTREGLQMNFCSNLRREETVLMLVPSQSNDVSISFSLFFHFIWFFRTTEEFDDGRYRGITTRLNSQLGLRNSNTKSFRRERMFVGDTSELIQRRGGKKNCLFQDRIWAKSPFTMSIIQ